MLKKILILISVLFTTTDSFAAIQTQSVEYKQGEAVMEGYIAYDDTQTAQRPGILIVHDWMGLGDFTKAKAQELAKQGYVAFAADIYGKNIRPKDAKEASELATKYKSDRALLRQRVRAAFDQLASAKQTDPKKIIGMGYCFGGTTALELARSGAPVVGTASFHGGLATPTPEDAKNIHSPVLIMHGADDPFVPQAEVDGFKKEMENAGVKYEFVAYPGAVHAFAVPEAGNDNSKGAAYNAQADKESWAKFQEFLTRVF